MDNPHEDLMREADRRDARYRHEEPVHTSVRIRYGPGGKSKLADAGGLGAFLNGGIEDEDRDRDDSTYLPRHRMIRDQVRFFCSHRDIS